MAHAFKVFFFNKRRKWNDFVWVEAEVCCRDRDGIKGVRDRRHHDAIAVIE